MRESELDSLFLPEGARGAGYKLRRYRGGEDMAAIAEVMNVSWAANSIDANVALEDIAHILAKTDFFDPVKDTVLLEKDQKLVGFAESYLRPLDDGTQLHPMQVLVLPEERNKGLRHALIGFCEHRAREIAAEHPGDAPLSARSVFGSDKRRVERTSGKRGLLALVVSLRDGPTGPGEHS
jgi:GNAT superfamily N-acetyltransferase